ncbi:MAG: helix-turn-helix transcriptional regulator [Halanaerobiaceae bacterium]|nr:helix-turn-helix transcriptional regulator [Halanaerobiaceae bacterium]
MIKKREKATQIELSKELNITNQALSQYELGKRIPDAEMIIRIAVFLMFPLIIFWTGQMKG